MVGMDILLRCIGKFPRGQGGLSRYLGPSIGVGPAMTAKNTMKKNGRVAHAPIYRDLTFDEFNDPEELKDRANFDDAILAKLWHGEHGDGTDPVLEAEGVTPEAMEPG